MRRPRRTQGHEPSPDARWEAYERALHHRVRRRHRSHTIWVIVVSLIVGAVIATAVGLSTRTSPEEAARRYLIEAQERAAPPAERAIGEVLRELFERRDDRAP